MWATISKNTAVNLLQFAVSAALVFVMTPIYLQALGDYDFGIWQILVALLGYANILDLGMQPTVARYVAHYLGRGEGKELNRVLASSLTILLALSLIAATGFALFAFFGSHLLAPSDQTAPKYALVTLMIAAAIPLTFVCFVYISFLEGLQRYEIRVAVGISHGLLFAGGFLLLRGTADALVLLAFLGIAVGLSRLFWLWFSLRRVAPIPLRFEAGQIDIPLARELFRFGGKSFVQGVSTNVESRMDALIVGIGLGPAAVVFYSIPHALALYIRNLGWTLSHAFMPALSRLSGEGSTSSMTGVFMRGSRYVLVAVAPLAVGIAVLGTEFVTLWIGPEYAENQLLIWLLTAYFFVPFLFPLQSRFLTAINEHGIFARLYPARAVANVLLSLALMPTLGLVGVAVGSLLPEAIVLAATGRKTLNAAGVSLGAYFQQVWLPCMIPTAAMVFAALAIKDAWALTTWPSLLLSAGILSITYACAATVVMSVIERKAIRLMFRREAP